mmetsp:Transcript_14250/g.33179  ORF Transcript_14250/g.33179 Transcript_14250/m.33179 type:complete len:114 (+) Transcript_14250:42-383(+)
MEITRSGKGGIRFRFGCARPRTNPSLKEYPAWRIGIDPNLSESFRVRFIHSFIRPSVRFNRLLAPGEGPSCRYRRCSKERANLRERLNRFGLGGGVGGRVCSLVAGRRDDDVL